MHLSISKAITDAQSAIRNRRNHRFRLFAPVILFHRAASWFTPRFRNRQRCAFCFDFSRWNRAIKVNLRYYVMLLYEKFHCHARTAEGNYDEFYYFKHLSNEALRVSDCLAGWRNHYQVPPSFTCLLLPKWPSVLLEYAFIWSLEYLSVSRVHGV